MSRWWRAYDEALNDPKLQVLGLEMVGAWFNLMCLASANRGVIRVPQVPFALRLSKHKAAAIIATLTAAGLLDRIEDDYRPHNWDGRQYQSDSSADRVKRHRDKRVAAGLERQWSPPKSLRQAVYDRDEHRCVYCGCAENLSLDHRTPEIRGGTHDISNLATACMSCNGAKRDLTEDEFRSRNDFSNVSTPLPKRPQSTEQKTEQKEDPELRSGAVAPRDVRADLFGKGLQSLAAITGKTPDSCRSLVGRWLKDCKDEAIHVLGAIEDAERNRVADPVAWINRSLQPRMKNGKLTVQDASRSLAERIGAFNAEPGSGGVCEPARGADVRLLPPR